MEVKLLNATYVTFYKVSDTGKQNFMCINTYIFDKLDINDMTFSFMTPIDILYSVLTELYRDCIISSRIFSKY